MCIGAVSCPSSLLSPNGTEDKPSLPLTARQTCKIAGRATIRNSELEYWSPLQGRGMEIQEHTVSLTNWKLPPFQIHVGSPYENTFTKELRISFQLFYSIKISKQWERQKFFPSKDWVFHLTSASELRHCMPALFRVLQFSATSNVNHSRHTWWPGTDGIRVPNSENENPHSK